MAELIYVDNSNLFIEGFRAAAVRNGMAQTIQEAIDLDIKDYSYRVDFGKLIQFLGGTDKAEIKRAYLVGSRPPPSDAIWGIAENRGFEVHVEDRNASNKEKRVDTGIVTEMMRDAYKLADAKEDTITLVSGDADFTPSIKRLIEDGFKVDVVFWDHASRELKDAASEFISLDAHNGAIRLT